MMTLEQAATSQLETAIELWFHEKDPVSIHTLAAAAEGIFETIARERGIKLSGSAKDFLTSTSKKFQNFMRDPQNFFKHGNPKLKWDFYHPEQGETFLASAVGSYLQLFSEPPPLILLFALWLGSELPAGEEPAEPLKRTLIQCAEFKQVTRGNRTKFFQIILPILIEEAHEGTQGVKGDV